MRLSILLPAVAILGAIGLSSVYVIEEREEGLVLQFGQVKRVVEEPGLYFKIPLLQDVTRYSNQIQGLVTDPQEITFADNRRLVVDAFARWRITDLEVFRRAVGLGGLESAGANLSRIVNGEVRDVLGRAPLAAVLSQDRLPLMNQIRDSAREKAASLGIEVIDVRLTRTDLPEQNLQATYERMKAERQREATDEIARGNEAAQTIRANATRQAVEITSEADKLAAVVRGQADAERSAIYAEAYGKDPEFYAFMRSLQAYGTAFPAGNTAFVLSPDGEFFRYFGVVPSLGGAGTTPGTALTGTGATGQGTTVAGGSAPQPASGVAAAP